MSKHLRAFSVAATRNVDRMRSVLFDVYDARKFDLPGDDGGFFAQASFFSFGSSALSYCSYGSPVSIGFRNQEYLRFQIGIAGRGRTTAAGSTADVDASRIVCSPAEAVVELGRSFEQFVLRLDRTMLEQDLTAILGAHPKQRLAFDLAADCTTGHARRFRDKVMQLVNNVDITDGPLPLPLLTTKDQSIRVAALYGMPNNFTDTLYGNTPAVSPWQVARIEEWIDAHWQSDVSIRRLAEVSGASVRSVFATFKKARGYTPMEYLKRVRLKAAREMLRRASPGASVTAIGFACHFSNPGHFARDYQRQFGELPSATLRAARAVAA